MSINGDTANASVADPFLIYANLRAAVCIHCVGERHYQLTPTDQSTCAFIYLLFVHHARHTGKSFTILFFRITPGSANTTNKFVLSFMM